MLSIGPTETMHFQTWSDKETEGAAAGALAFLTADGLFRGQSPGFVRFMARLAREADAARREEGS
jgi:hypothetical protein